MSCKNETTAIIEIILGITIDHKLKSDEHGNYLCKMQCQEFNGLACIASFMDVSKKRSITKAFIESQFVCCPLICIFHGWGFKNKMNHIHKRALRITHNYKSSSFGELTNKNSFVTIHHRKLRALAKETYKVIYGISPRLLNKLLIPRQCSHEIRGKKFLKGKELSQ